MIRNSGGEGDVFMKFLKMTIVTAFIIGCSSSQNEMAYNPHEYRNPEFNALKHRFRARSRGISSVHNKKTEFKGQNLKTLYTLGLFSQYNELRSLIGTSKGEIKSCSKFHTAFLNHQQGLNPGKTYKRGELIKRLHKKIGEIKPSMKDFYPEFSLPLRTSNSTVWDQREHFKSAFIEAYSLHLTKLNEEITRLCEDGFSNHYYIFENMVSYFQKEKGRKLSKEKRFEILLKTPIVSNWVLINSLKGTGGQGSRSPASFQKTDSLETELHHRLNADWMKSYARRVVRKK